MLRKTISAIAFVTALLAGAPVGTGPSGALAQGGCMSQGEARAAVSSGQAAPFSAFSGSLRSRGDVVSSCLRPGGGGLVYVVRIVTPNGQVTQVVIDARTGAPR